jgi:hypothetical protein
MKKTLLLLSFLILGNMIVSSQSRFESEKYSCWVDDNSTFVMLLNKEDIIKVVFDFQEYVPESWTDFTTLYEAEEGVLVLKVCKIDSGKVVKDEAKTLRLRYPLHILDLMAEIDSYIVPEILQPVVEVIPDLGYEFELPEKYKKSDLVTLKFKTPEILTKENLRVSIRELEKGQPVPATFDTAKSRFDIKYENLPKTTCVISVEGERGKYDFLIPAKD